MGRKLLICLMLFTKTFVQAQDQYDISKIPAELMKDASVVIRMEQTVFDVKSISHATLTYKTAVTVLNKNGERASAMAEFYDRFSTVYNLKACMYNEKGKKVKEYQTVDFKDLSAISDGSVYEDGRMKQLQFLNSIYPYTIEYSYSKDFTGITTYPSWYPVVNFGCSAQKSEYLLKVPEDITFRYLKSEGLKTDSDRVKGKIEYHWTAENIKAIAYEPLSTGVKNVMPWCMLAPDNFEYDHSKGSMQTWQNIGQWIYELNREPQNLPSDVKIAVSNIIAKASSAPEKVRLLYQYLQANTRYVSVQLGIGGYKPTAATKVAAVNYGDCKALSNYMKALLNEAGINSNLVVIGYNMPSLNTRFSSLNQANHMILFVPLQKDTIWLECTSQHIPAGHLSYGCTDKDVLLVTKDGGKLVRSLSYTPEENYQKRNIDVQLDSTGGAEIQISTDYGNAQFDSRYGMMLLEPSEQQKMVLSELPIQNIRLAAIKYNQADKNVALLNERISLKSSQYLSAAADRRFLQLNIMNRREDVPSKVDNRRTYFAVPFGYRDDDVVSFTIPSVYKIDYLPAEVSIESEFGKYKAKAEQQEGKVVYSRTLVMYNKLFKPEHYNALVDFYKKVYQADKVKAVLSKH